MIIGKGKIANHFRKWYGNKTIFDKVKVEPQVGAVVVQVYRYEGEVNPLLKNKLIIDGKDAFQESKSRTFPIGRIVCSGISEFKPDDIVKLPTSSVTAEENPLWKNAVQWNEDHKDPKEQVDVERYYYAGVMKWLKENHYDIYMFKDDGADAEEVGSYEDLVFLLGKTIIEGKIKIVDL